MARVAGCAARLEGPEVKFLAFVLRRLVATALMLAAVSVLSFLAALASPRGLFRRYAAEPANDRGDGGKIEGSVWVGSGLRRALLGLVSLGVKGRIRRLDGLRDARRRGAETATLEYADVGWAVDDSRVAARNSIRISGCGATRKLDGTAACRSRPRRRWPFRRSSLVHCFC